MRKSAPTRAYRPARRRAPASASSCAGRLPELHLAKESKDAIADDDHAAGDQVCINRSVHAVTTNEHQGNGQMNARHDDGTGGHLPEIAAPEPLGCHD